MSMRLPYLLAATVVALPLTARADCAARIASVESHPAVLQGDNAEGGQARQDPGAPADGVRADGGDSGHAVGGPATPPESWFTDSEHEDRASVLAHLHNARQAQKDGDEEACLDAVQQAEAALEGR